MKYGWGKGASVMGAAGAIAAIGTLGAGCDDGGDGDATQDPIELVGSWTSEFGDETISETRWDGFCQQAIVRWDNDANEAILETLAGEGCGLGFGRVIWLEPSGGSFYYCATSFNQASADAAANAPEMGVDRQQTQTGCGGFPWSMLTRR